MTAARTDEDLIKWEKMKKPIKISHRIHNYQNSWGYSVMGKESHMSLNSLGAHCIAFTDPISMYEALGNPVTEEH